MGPAPEFSAGEAFLHHSCLMTFSIDFSSAAFRLLIPSQPLGRKMGQENNRKERGEKTSTRKLNAYCNAVTFVQIFYAELEKKRERKSNFSHRSAHVVEASAHVLPCIQAPVHPCSLTCSLVWNQLQKAAVILCYSASPILKAAIKAWH